MEQSPSWEANWFLQLIKKFPVFYGTRKFITELTSARHLPLSWANSMQSPQPLPTSWTSILVLSSHLHLGLPSGLFPSSFSTKTLCKTFPSSIRAACPAHLLLDFITRTILGEEYSEEYRPLRSLFLITGVQFNAYIPNSGTLSYKWYIDTCFLYEQYVNIPTTVLYIPLPSSRLFNTGSKLRGTFLLVRWDFTPPEVFVPTIFVFARCHCSTCCCRDGS